MAGGWAFLGLSRLAAPAPSEGPGDRSLGLAVSSTGGVALIEENEHVRQSILILLATRPGERVMRPDYGCPLHRLMFNPNDATTAGLAIHYVRQALLRFEPRAEILHLDAGPRAGATGTDDPARATLFVHLDYRVRATRHAERLEFSLDLTGDAA
ncbi:hypothetical protein FHS82_001508 [Pseudochelatococcus lubricantis]|uniref:IraD/Gp25-like domain-containing protein n=1 Tax=Pseudochelatococcus lubricantis TaxID=1538102 RepID=A0ABX0UY63_9HYPH|nr:GPW/gp25 family protein [Pseudochelatococcus lubricantis]NIJ57672.1 hypothetical protein [Pseudochelatococcus lubricantis]